MIGMLVADNAAKLVLARILGRGLAWKMRNVGYPGKLPLDADLECGSDAGRLVEAAGQQLDHRAADLAVGERRSARPAEVALGAG
jgi:hypothetical protein